LKIVPNPTNLDIIRLNQIEILRVVNITEKETIVDEAEVDLVREIVKDPDDQDQDLHEEIVDIENLLEAEKGIETESYIQWD